MTEVDSLQKIVAGQEARLQVLERPAAPRPLITVGDLGRGRLQAQVSVATGRGRQPKMPSVRRR